MNVRCLRYTNSRKNYWRKNLLKFYVIIFLKILVSASYSKKYDHGGRFLKTNIYSCRSGFNNLQQTLHNFFLCTCCQLLLHFTPQSFSPKMFLSVIFLLLMLFVKGILFIYRLMSEIKISFIYQKILRNRFFFFQILLWIKLDLLLRVEL